MNEGKFVQYLKFARDHYISLGNLMENQKEERYANEHRGKIKFINLLLLKIEEGDFDE